MKTKLTIVLIVNLIAGMVRFPRSAMALDGAEQSCRRQLQTQLARGSLVEQEVATWLGAVAIMNNPQQWRSLLQSGQSTAQQQRTVATVLCTRNRSPRQGRRCSNEDSRFVRFRKVCSL